MKTYIVTKTFTETDIRDLMIHGAAGARYWARAELHVADGYLEVWERENDTGEPGLPRKPDFIVTPESIAKGLQLLCDTRNFSLLWARVSKGYADREDADIVLQLAVFGEVKYG